MIFCQCVSGLSVDGCTDVVLTTCLLRTCLIGLVCLNSSTLISSLWKIKIDKHELQNFEVSYSMHSCISNASIITPTKYTVFITYIYYSSATCFGVPRIFIRENSSAAYWCGSYSSCFMKYERYSFALMNLQAKSYLSYCMKQLLYEPHMYQFLLKAGLLSFVQMPEGWLEVSIRKFLRPAISTQVFLGLPVYYSKYWDGSRYFQVATYSPPYLNSQVINLHSS